MEKNVYPYAPNAWIDEKKTKIGYEIPFTREFYKYVAPRKSDEIYASLQELDRREQELMARIIGKWAGQWKIAVSLGLGRYQAIGGQNLLAPV